MAAAGHRGWLRRGVQGLVWGGFLVLAALTATTAAERFAVPGWAHAVFALDPLVGLAAIVAGTAGTAVLVGLVLTLLLTLAGGRIFCHWLCPLGSSLDLVRLPLRGLARLCRLPQPVRAVLPHGGGWFLIALLVALPLGVSLIGLGEPLGLVYRALATAILPLTAPAPPAGLDEVRFIGAPLRFQAASYPLGALLGAWLGLILLAEAVQARFWCRNLCPSGAAFDLVDRLRRRWRRLVPMPAADAPGAVSRRSLLVAGLGGAALPLLAGGGGRAVPEDRLRPPGAGADEAAFLTACVRCGACVRACPTHGLQPMLFADGVAGLLAPRLIPRLGACEHGCRACAEVCPTGAIPLTDLAAKQRLRIGRAVHDRRRCLPWAGGGECRVCWEHCPVVDKAITLRLGRAPNGQALPLPDVDPERCIGCGTCAFVCPIEGEAGVRVFHLEAADAARKRLHGI